MKFCTEDTERLLKAKSKAVYKYQWIIKQLYQVDVSKDREFQKTFNGFYRVRRNEAWQKIFYQLFEECKYMKDVDFSFILTRIYEETGRIEASFSSKLLSTIDTSMPIWDSIVLQNLGIKNHGRACEEKVRTTIKLYEQICQWYQDFRQTEDAKSCAAVFNRTFPDLTYINEIKKLDFMIWATREENSCSFSIKGIISAPDGIDEKEFESELKRLFLKKKWTFAGNITAIDES